MKFGCEAGMVVRDMHFLPQLLIKKSVPKDVIASFNVSRCFLFRRFPDDTFLGMGTIFFEKWMCVFFPPLIVFENCITKKNLNFPPPTDDVFWNILTQKVSRGIYKNITKLFHRLKLKTSRTIVRRLASENFASSSLCYSGKYFSGFFEQSNTWFWDFWVFETREMLYNKEKKQWRGGLDVKQYRLKMCYMFEIYKIQIALN